MGRCNGDKLNGEEMYDTPLRTNHYNPTTNHNTPHTTTHNYTITAKIPPSTS